MNKRILVFTFLFFVTLIASACEVITTNSEDVERIEYKFKFTEPSKFPFEVNEVTTEIDIKDYWDLFIFYYRNVETTQQIKYILSKVSIESNNQISEGEKSKYKEYKLENGLSAYYEEDSTSQVLWWEREDGFLARFVYFTNVNDIALDEYQIEAEGFVQLANQVQDE